MTSDQLSRTYTTLLEALNRHRGKGQQKVTVEHVHVHAGGQAIVGSVEAGGGVVSILLSVSNGPWVLCRRDPSNVTGPIATIPAVPQ